MQVTVKKAHALALSLAQIKAPLPAKLTVSVHAQQLPDIEAAYHKLVDAVCQGQNRILAQFQIRDLVSKANEGAINALVTKRAMLDKQLEALNTLTKVEHMPTPAEIQSMIDAAKADTSYGRASSVNADLSTVFAEPMRSDLKRQRVQVEDELARLNFSTMVELPEHVVTILREHDLV